MLVKSPSPIPRRRIRSSEDAVLIKSRRRCCLCFHLTGKREAVVGQLAHIDHDRSKSTEDNLAWLCLEHHTLYDSKTSQHKNYTSGELKHYKMALEEAVEHAEIGLEGPSSHPLPLRFASIEMAERSSWFEMSEHAGEDFTLFSAPWRGATGEGELPNDKVTDPILDVILISQCEACIVKRIGIQTIRHYSIIAGPPSAQRLSISEELAIRVRWGQTSPQLVRMSDPWYLVRAVPFRFTLRLLNYAEELPGNRGVLRVAIETDKGLLLSDGVCLGS